ncbi:cell division protein FtsQ/DivIB [Alkalibacillus aidingensis]|uniref:cell division protein FtsQ/DivIB n=1 Tax=Alkalibacillus aidingensis TaxID=2747607 RepID=UPI001660EA6A|nr:FtsQ-type POTRA domain-containing protein [Alkalibacillus aidingensis]
MAEKKIVSIEDRIPQLKQARKRKANRRFILYLSVILLLVLVIVYMQSPLSHVKSVEVENNGVVSVEQITDLAGIDWDESYWKQNTDEIALNIQEHPEIEQAEVERSWYNSFVISVQEYKRVAYQKDGESYYPILQNGELLSEVKLDKPRSDAPLLHGFEDSNYLSEISEQLASLPDSISLLISEIYWDPDEVNRDRIRFYTVDGQEVVGVISNFASKMEVYPSISAQINDDLEGVLHIDVGAYFVPFEDQDMELEIDEIPLEESF